jgi:PAS domain S-box-containing protein
MKAMVENKPMELLGEKKIADYSKGNSRTFGRFSLLMVFLNGFVLVITIFIMLLIYTDKVNKKFSEETSSRIINELNSHFDYVEKALNLLIVFDGEQTDRQFDIPGILAVYNVNPELENGYNIIFEKIGHNVKVKSNALNYTLPSKLDYRMGQNGVELVVPSDDPKKGYYVAVLDSNFLNNKFQEDQYNKILQFSLYSSDKEIKIIDFNKLVNDSIETTQNFYLMTLNSHEMELYLSIEKNPYLIFNNRIPFIFLLFGIILTVIGLLFVRNNQKQSSQISEMNAALEKKNKDLEVKIEETSSISKKLKDKELEYKDVINSVQDVLFEVDETGRIVFLNKSWELITKRKIEDSYGQDIVKLFHDEDQEHIRIQFFEFMKGNNPGVLKGRLKNQDGSYRTTDIMFSVMRLDTADIRHVIGTIHDIDDKARAQQALDEVEKKYRKIFDNAANGIYQIHPDGKIISGNPSLAYILGYDTIDELLHQGISLQQCYADKSNYQTFQSELIRHDTVRNFEIQIQQANGNIIWVNDNARVVRDNDGNISYYEGAIEDITQRKQAELDLHEAKVNSDLASRAKSEFLTNMSHELRTPLNAIIGFSEIIKSEALGEIENETYTDYAKDIHASGTRLLSVINEILGISKIDAGDRQINETVINLKSICQTCIDLMASKIEASELLIANVIVDDMPAIIGEELAFKQIVMNLLSNAIKFTPKGGTVTFDIEYNADKAEEGLRLSITDTGVGIEESDIPKALSPFGQLDNALSKSHAGTGLGLTLVRSLIHLHGGHLEMVSQKNLGTTVSLVIPMKRVAVQKEIKSESGQSNITRFSDYK